jgi:hypothetical protein
MAIQEFDRPPQHSSRQLRWDWEFYISVALFIAAISFISYTIMSIPGPVNDRPLINQQVSEMPNR